MSSVEQNRGTLGIGDDGTFRIQFVRGFPVTTERLWRWLTDDELLQRWLPGCRIDGRVGGEVLFDFGEEGAATGTVTAAERPDPGGRLVHSWRWDGVPESQVTWELRPHGTGSRLTLTHSEVLPEPARDFATGWHVMLDALTLAEAGEPTDAAWAAMGDVAGLYVG
jgi:uncharacterized protein YndB with AHSA1/START domain